MQTLGLTLHIDKATHQLGNMPDHIYTESLDVLGVRHSFTGEYISDHRLVGTEINKRKATVQLDNQLRRHYKELNQENFTQEFNNKEILKHSELGEIWSALETELRRMLDKIVPEIKQKKKPRPPRPWYTNRLLDQKRIVRTWERVFIKYRQQHQWKAFTRERNRYNTMLKYNKRSSLASLVQSAEKDSKKLFKIVNSLLGRREDNPMPPAR